VVTGSTIVGPHDMASSSRVAQWRRRGFIDLLRRYHAELRAQVGRHAG
jgi:hypothetical protein